jgi:hypothetical protein
MKTLLISLYVNVRRREEGEAPIPYKRFIGLQVTESELRFIKLCLAELMDTGHVLDAGLFSRPPDETLRRPASEWLT